MPGGTVCANNLTAQKNELEEKLGSSELYSEENKDLLRQLLTDQAYLQKEFDQAEMDWMEASEAYEAAQ